MELDVEFAPPQFGETGFGARFGAAGRTGRYYFCDAPFTALWGEKYLPISEPIHGFFAACAKRTATSSSGSPTSANTSAVGLDT